MTNKQCHVLAVLLCSAICAAATAAETMTMQQTAHPFRREYNGKVVDVLGVTPGMTVNQVADLLSKDFQAVKPSFEKQTVGNALAVSQPYVSEGMFLGGNDNVTVTFGPPSTGNTVVALQRDVMFPDPVKAPTFENFKSLLIAKYGEPSKVQAVQDGTVFMNWTYSATALHKCNDVFCGQGTGANIDFNAIPQYETLVRAGNDLSLKIQITPQSNERSRVGSVTTILDDNQNKLLSLTEAFKQLDVATKKFQQAPTPDPKL